MNCDLWSRQWFIPRRGQIMTEIEKATVNIEDRLKISTNERIL